MSRCACFGVQVLCLIWHSRGPPHLACVLEVHLLGVLKGLKSHWCCDFHADCKVWHGFLFMC